MIAVVILSFTDNVLASRGIKSSNGRSFIILRSGVVSSSFNKNKSANFSGEKKKFNEDFRSVYYSVLLTREPASFWRENVIAVVISTTSFSENVVVAETSYQM